MNPIQLYATRMSDKELLKWLEAMFIDGAVCECELCIDDPWIALDEAYVRELNLESLSI